MVDLDRRPTAQEIEELIDTVRRDPASPAFVDLGEAYLALGRPRDALRAGNLGLEAAPDHLEGRILLARAYVAMHQWKEAQGELLRVVKVDRRNRHGFALLGEVLVRRQDFERAVPILQHAQSLDPTSPHILAMLRRARAGQPLDPPPPVPTPVPPRGETDSAPPILRSGAAAPPPAGEPVVPVAGPAMPARTVEPAPSGSAEPAAEPAIGPAIGHAIGHAIEHAHSGVPAPAGTAPAADSAPATDPARSAAPPPPASIEGVRPRIVPAARPQNAAAAALRQSVAVGENYLNDLLAGGLLDVAGVRVPDPDFDLRPDRRWGRSTRRAFVFLFVVLVLGIGGSVAWYGWSERQKAAAVARLQDESQAAISLGDFAGLETCLHKLRDALEADQGNLLTYAYVVECAGLEALLYGTDPDRVDAALKHVVQLRPDEPGGREVLIGKAALELSRLGIDDGTQRDPTATAQVAKSTLAELRKALDAYAANHDKGPDEDHAKLRWAQWLRGRAMLAAGERTAGRAVIEAASRGDDGLVAALIDTADLLVDDGRLDEALAIYDRAAARAEDHPLIVIGRSLARAEASVDSAEAIRDLSVELPGDLPPRLRAYRHLALAIASTAVQDFARAKDALHKAVAGRQLPNEPRFWARIAWAHYVRGDLPATSRARARMAWFGKVKAEDDPTAQLVDAALLLASGQPEKALALADRLQGVRPQILRAYADLDLGKPEDALREAEGALNKSPDHLEAQILREQARMVTAEGKDRANATAALEKLARSARSKIGRHALGMAHHAGGNVRDAQAQLALAVTDIAEDAPNPLAYRSRTVLADIAFQRGDLAGAGKQLDEALELNSGYFPALGLQAKVVLENGEPDRALALLAPVFAEIGTAPPALRLVYAEALGTRNGATAADKASAREMLESIKVQNQLPDADLARVAAAIDPALPSELGLPEPADPGAASPPVPARPPAPVRRPGATRPPVPARPPARPPIDRSKRR